jgi:hypothetical protein
VVGEGRVGADYLENLIRMRTRSRSSVSRHAE